MSINISKQKRENLIHKINEVKRFIENVNQDENALNLLTYMNELEKELRNRRYGLIFEEHRENIDEILDTHVPVLAEEKELFINNGGDMNFLIEGDNLAALMLLEKTHKGEIDLIYIDPPYNSGEKDFMYDDKYIDKDDGYRHSKWISFMYKRLTLAKSLLTDKGFIFISIDDKEASQLKILCDDIFGENNYEKTDYIQVRYPDKTLKSDMRYHKEIEQVLVYRKSFVAKPYLQPKEYDYNKFIFMFEELDEGVETILGGKKVIIFEKSQYKITKLKAGQKTGLKEIWATGTILNGNSSGRFFRDYLTGRKEIDGLGVMYKVYGIGNDQFNYRYFTGPKRMNATKGKYYQGVPIDKLQEDATKTTPIPNFHDMAGDFGNIRHEGGVDFNGGKKPVKLILKFINYFKEKDIIALDFFAGSGTTGHAIMQQNSEDGGRRKYILVTNDQNNICRNKTYVRLKNAIIDLGNDSSLKYNKIEYISVNEKLYYEYANSLLHHIKELVELENAINFESNNTVSIILTDEELIVFIENIELYTDCSTIYLGHDVITDGNQDKILLDNNIKINVIPNYYYKELEG